MPWLIEYAPWLTAMAVLVLASAFFSSSEAAMFYLSRQDRRAFESGNRAQRLAATLLENPDRLLTAVLFWNLVTNIVYFSLVSIVGVRMDRAGQTAGAGVFSLGALFTLMFASEMLPKTFAVLQTRPLATLVSVPLAVAVRAIDPIAPAFGLAVTLSRRLLWPGFRAEPYLEVGDLERALELSSTDPALQEKELAVLQNLVLLVEIRADEMMRPRPQLRLFRPPVALADLEGRMPLSSYVLITEPESDEIVAAVPLAHMSEVPAEHLEYYAEDVVYVPWCTTAADALEEMRRTDRRVAVVVNEFGETIGVLTYEDLLETIFHDNPSRSARLLKLAPIHEVRPGVWRVNGLTSLRRLAKHFGVDLPPSKSVTIAGILQEQLERMPREGDHCRWFEFDLTVVSISPRGQLLVELHRQTGEGAGP